MTTERFVKLSPLRSMVSLKLIPWPIPSHSMLHAELSYSGNLVYPAPQLPGHAQLSQIHKYASTEGMADDPLEV